MDLNQLASFQSVAQTLSFTGAARRLGVPQSTVSRQINDLESQLGVRLFYRTKRDVQLTQEGQTFLPYAGEILEAARKGAYALEQLRDGAQGRLSLAVSAAPTGLLERCLNEFARTYPDIVVELTRTSCGRCLMDEDQVPFDLQLLPKDLLPETDGLDSLTLGEEGLSLLLPPNHPLAAKPVELSALSRERFILVTEAENPILYMQVLDLCRTHRFQPHVISRSDDVEAVRLSAAAGLGVAILPASQAGPAGRPIPDTEGLMVYAAVWKRSLLNPALRLFLPFLPGDMAGE